MRAWLFPLFLALTSAGCRSPSRAPFVGTWGATYGDAAISWTFKADGTVTSNSAPLVAYGGSSSRGEGRWSEDDGIVEVRWSTGNRLRARWALSPDGKSLTLVDPASPPSPPPGSMTVLQRYE